jgi:DNA-3-methyladenine glycosylase
MKNTRHLKRAYFLQPTLHLARDLLGRRLVLLDKKDQRISGLITEAEAYVGTEDLACHARVGRTKRNDAMWGPPGHAYVYFTYGVHWMLNFVTERDGFPSAVLIRGIWPQEGLDEMLLKRPVIQINNLTNGPAKLCQALGIDGSWNGVDLCGEDSRLFVEQGFPIDDDRVTSGPRVGLNTVPEPWKSKPWRFLVDPTIFINGEFSS